MYNLMAEAMQDQQETLNSLITPALIEQLNAQFPDFLPSIRDYHCVSIIPGSQEQRITVVSIPENSHSGLPPIISTYCIGELSYMDEVRGQIVTKICTVFQTHAGNGHMLPTPVRVIDIETFHLALTLASKLLDEQPLPRVVAPIVDELGRITTATRKRV